MFNVRSLICVAAGVLVLPGLASSQGQVQNEIRQMILADNAYTTENLKDKAGGVSMHGSVEFWSSGGLIQEVPPDGPIISYESFNLVPKHIQVFPLAEGVAVAQYYVEGSFQPVGQEPVSHYMTRVTQVFVRESGAWVVRAAHWSPIVGGSGTRQTSIIM
jgi:hypothetical protein